MLTRYTRCPHYTYVTDGLLVRQAGAGASAGEGGCLLELLPKSTQERTPVFIGSSDDVAECLREICG